MRVDSARAARVRLLIILFSGSFRCAKLIDTMWRGWIEERAHLPAGPASDLIDGRELDLVGVGARVGHDGRLDVGLSGVTGALQNPVEVDRLGFQLGRWLGGEFD